MVRRVKAQVRHGDRAARRPIWWCRLVGGAALAAVLLSACVNVVQQNAPGALRTAESRGRFELNCPTATATILSEKIIQGWRFDGSEHTIGVRGCGREQVYETFCSDASDCNAIAQTGRINALSTLAP